MKVSIITCHRVINYGAILQAYALSYFIKNIKEVNEVCLIDYEPSYIWKPNYNFIKLIIWRIYRMPDYIKGRIIFAKFIKNRLNVTSKTYSNLEDLVKMPPESDIYITGSDQVWNYRLENGNDGSYFLEFVPPGKIKASYAASIAQDELPNPYKHKFQNWLKDFDFISVREESANKLIKSIGFEDVETVLDPVYLLDSYQWSEFAKEIVAPKYSYVLLYAFNCTREIADYAYELSRRKGKKLIIINTMVNDFRFKADYHVWQKSPEYFVKIFENADEVITNSFHGFSFSVLFKKQVYIFSKKTGGNSRLFNLMNSLQIADCRKGELIDYNKVYEILESKIKKSKLFVESIITYETKE